MTIKMPWRAFEAAFQTYQAQMAEREQRLYQAKAALAERIEIEKAAAQQDYEQRLATLRDQGLE